MSISFNVAPLFARSIGQNVTLVSSPWIATAIYMGLLLSCLLSTPLYSAHLLWQEKILLYWRKPAHIYYDRGIMVSNDFVRMAILSVAEVSQDH